MIKLLQKDSLFSLKQTMLMLLMGIIFAKANAADNPIKKSPNLNEEIRNFNVILSKYTSDTTKLDSIKIGVNFGYTSVPTTGSDALDLSEIQVTNGTLSTLTGTGNLREFYVKPIAVGKVTLKIPQNVVRDINNTKSNNESNLLEVVFENDLKEGLSIFFPLGNTKRNFTYDAEFEINQNVTMPTAADDHWGNANGSYLFSGTALLNRRFFVTQIYKVNNVDKTGGFAASMWVKPNTKMDANSTTKRVFLAQKGNFSIFYQAGKIQVHLLNGTKKYEYTTDLNTQWYFLGISVTPKKEVKLYIDNNVHSLGAAPVDNVFAGNTKYFLEEIYIGGELNTNPINSADAYMEGVRIYAKPIDDLDANNLYNYPNTIYKVDIKDICMGETYKGHNTTGYYNHTNKLQNQPNEEEIVKLNVKNFSLFFNASATNIYKGDSIILDAYGYDTYSLDNGARLDSAIFPTDTTTYTITAVGKNGCTKTMSVTVNVQDNPINEVTISSTKVKFCQGASDVTTKVTISSSQTGFKYSLKNAAADTLVADEIAGTGNALEFTTKKLKKSMKLEMTASNKVSPSYGNGVYFDGVDDVLSTAGNIRVKLENTFSIEGWVQPFKNKVVRILHSISSLYYTTSGDFIIDTYDSNKNGKALRFYFNNGGHHSVIASGVIEIGKWNHIAATFDKGVIKLYVNGKKVKEEDTGVASFKINKRLIFGSDFDANHREAEFYQGMMDDFRFWTYPRSEKAIQATMDTEVGAQSGLYLYYKMNQTDGAYSIANEIASSNTGGNKSLFLHSSMRGTTSTGKVAARYASRKMTNTIQISIGDDVAPTVIPKKKVTLYLDSNGVTSLTTSNADSASYDNCNAKEKLVFTLDKTNFNAANLANNGVNVVKLTAKDTANNSAYKEFQVIVKDTIKPIVKTKNIVVSLNASGNATIEPKDVDDGSSDNAGDVILSLDKLTFNSVGEKIVELTVSDKSGNKATGTVTVIVKPFRKVQTALIFEALAAKTFGDAPFDLSATGGSTDGAFSYTSSNPVVATVEGSKVTIVGAGKTTITAKKEGNAEYSDATASQELVVNKANQVIVFGALGEKILSEKTFILVFTGGKSGSPVIFTSSNLAVATIEGNKVTMLKEGETVITANQAGNDNYNAATAVLQTLKVTSKKAQSITFEALTAKTFGDAPFDLSATGGSTDGVFIYTSSNSAVATVEGSKVTIVGAGKTTITAKKEGNAEYSDATASQELVVNKANQVIVFGALGEKSLSEKMFTLVFTGGKSGSPVIFTSSNSAVATIEGNKVTMLQEGETVITANQAGNDNYNAATAVTQTLKVTNKVLGLTDAFDVNIYPNQTVDLLHIEGNNVYKVLIYDTLGKKIIETENTNCINVLGLSKGVYLVHLINKKGEVVNRRFIKK